MKHAFQFTTIDFMIRNYFNVDRFVVSRSFPTIFFYSSDGGHLESVSTFLYNHDAKEEDEIKRNFSSGLLNSVNSRSNKSALILPTAC